ncbi:MAG: penicillin acylase family protein, partial [Smithellaceae bacterium]
AKLEGLDLSGTPEDLAGIAGLYPLLHAVGLSGQAASNNWAISKERTEGRASILANDQHLVLSMPAIYNLMHIRCPDFDVAGVNLAGLPAMVAGYNGQVAWGMTMVMADNQDIFLEQIKSVDGRPHYLYKEQWLPVEERPETFRVKDRDPVSVTFQETIHGPLLNDILAKKPLHVIQAKKLNLPYGIAISQANIAKEDKSVDAFFALGMAKSVEEASTYIKQIRSIPLNMVFADRDNIAWQVTGNYPVRAAGRGLMPSPGWSGAYDWTGFLDENQLPFVKNPEAGFIGTANHRTLAKEDPRVLSSSWYWPERAERIEQMILAKENHTFQTSIQMQMDTLSLFVPKLKDIILADAITKEIAGWPDARQRQRAKTALDLLKDFDGNMTLESQGAALVSAFLDQVTKHIFLDELGPADAATWQAFLVLNNESYNATCDHLLMRGNESPFWDDIRTLEKETKAQILARSLEGAVAFLEKKLGSDARKWRWGALHTYHWKTDTYALLPQMDRLERMALQLLSPYFNRGPYPAPGDHTTLNVSNYMIGKDFKTWIIPSVRLIVDFSRPEPMIAVNSAGQSDHPSSPHYDDGITLWRKGGYIPFPFRDEGINAHYGDLLTLRP